MNPAPDSPTPKCRPWGRRFAAFLLVALRHSSSWILRVFFSLLILMAILFAYLHLVGIPSYLTDIFLDRMARRGYHLQIERLTLEIDRGLVASNVRIYASAQAPEPFMTAETFTVALDPTALLGSRKLAPSLSIANGMLQAHLGQNQFGARQGSRTIAADRINLRFSASDREILLREFAAHFLGIQFRGRGVAHLPSPAEPAQADAAPSNPLAAALLAIENSPDWLLRLVEQVNAIEFNAEPKADFTFAIFPAHPEANAFSLRMDGTDGLTVRGVAFDRFNVDATWKKQQFHLPDLRLQKGNGILGISGWLNSTSQVVAADLFNTLPLGTFLDLLPDDLRLSISKLFDNPAFPLRVEAKIGPAPMATAAEHFSGRLVLSDAKIRDVPVDRLDVSVSRDGPSILVENASVQLASVPIASQLTVRDGSFRIDTRRFKATVAGSINPHVVKPLLTPSMRNIVDWFGINEPIEGNVVVGGTAGNPAIYVYGPVQATNVSIYGVAIQSLDGQLDITNEVMHITGATLVRPEGIARGEVHMAFSNQTLRLDVDSLLDARDTTKMLGPIVEKFMVPFQLDGPARIQIEGLLDYCNFSMNQLRGHVEAQRFGYDRWVADTAVFDMNVVGRRLAFTNAVATAYGGSFAGHGALYPVGNDANWRYEVDMAASGARLQDLLAASFKKPMKDLRGTLDGTGKIGGYVGPGTGPGVTGTGQATIRDGLLFQTKLFSGLATVLGKIIPDFSLFAQTDASGTYAIRNSQIHSDDIELLGSLFSVKATGSYSFGGDLRYRVEVQPLRGGPVAALVRLATLPVTRLLEFRLTGTFEEPHWRPVNLPSELFE